MPDLINGCPDQSSRQNESRQCAFLQTTEMMKLKISLCCSFIFVYITFTILCHDSAAGLNKDLVLA